MIPGPKTLPLDADVIAPDGCEVRILAQTPRGSMAHFTLGPQKVSRAVAHRTVEEVWFFLSGRGRMWRRLGEREEIAEVAPGVSLSIPLSIAAGLAGLFLTGQTINLMTLGGLALAIGLLVDNATVTIENIHRNQSLGKPLTIAILDGSNEVIQPLTVATLAICIVFFPVLLLVIWELSARVGWLSSRVLPEPASIFLSGWQLLKSGELHHHVLVSLQRALTGLAIGGGLGLVLGLVTGTFKRAETLLDEQCRGRLDDSSLAGRGVGAAAAVVVTTARTLP